MIGRIEHAMEAFIFPLLKTSNKNIIFQHQLLPDSEPGKVLYFNKHFYSIK